MSTNRECIGEVNFNGASFHGGAVPHAATPQDLFIDLTYPYRDTGLDRSTTIRQSNPLFTYMADSSATLGPGLYTASREEAEKYALLRAGGKLAFVCELTIPEAKLFDFRDQENPKRNAPVPLEIAGEWREYYLKNRILVFEYVKNNISILTQCVQTLRSYPAHLDDFIDRLKTGRQFEPRPKKLSMHADRYTEFGTNPAMRRGSCLRDLLRTLPFDRDWTYSWFGGLWVRFMQDEIGVDGTIFMEAGEGDHFEDTPSIVIHNLAVVTEQKFHTS